MMTYQEWLKIVEGTEAMRDVARRLGLGDSDMHRALEALMPATMMNGFAQTVFGAGRPPVGNPFESFFASPEIKRAVAKQAAALSGMNETFFNDIMPAFASGFATAAQQFSKTATSSGAGDASGHAMGEAIGGMMAAMMGLAPDKAKEADAAKDPAQFGMQMFESFVKAGQNAQADYLKAMQDMFKK